MFRKVFTGLHRFIPSLKLQTSVNALPQRNLFTSTAVFNYDRDVDSIKFFSANKKFFTDIKEADGPSGKYLKISEVSNNKRATVKIEKEDAHEVLKNLIKMTEPDASKYVSIDSKSPKSKGYELEISEFNERQSWIIKEQHHDGKTYKVFVPDEVWTQMVQNIAILLKEHLPEQDN